MEHLKRLLTGIAMFSLVFAIAAGFVYFLPIALIISALFICYMAGQCWRDTSF